MNTPAELPAPKRSACARVYDSLHRHFGPEIRAEAELCICRRPWVGSLMLSSSAASADACQTPTVHGRALPVSSGQSPMPSIWCDYASWCANESGCVGNPTFQWRTVQPPLSNRH